MHLYSLLIIRNNMWIEKRGEDLCVPVRVEEPGCIGDTIKIITLSDKDYEKYMMQYLAEQKRRV
jgi:hypothetical protein